MNAPPMSGNLEKYQKALTIYNYTLESASSGKNLYVDGAFKRLCEAYEKLSAEEKKSVTLLKKSRYPDDGTQGFTSCAVAIFKQSTSKN